MPRDYSFSDAIRALSALCEAMATAITMFGHTVRVYDLERTICDLFRSRSTVDPQDLQSAFQNYMRSAHTDLVKLMNYAREFRLVNVMRPYLEAVMPA